MPRKQNTSGDNYYSALPTRLRALLTDRNITQQELADYIGKSRQIISRYADGSSAPDWQTIVKISAFFGVSSDYLLGITDIPVANTDLRAVCDYTGLSEKSVEILHMSNTPISEWTEKEHETFDALGANVSEDEYILNPFTAGTNALFATSIINFLLENESKTPILEDISALIFADFPEKQYVFNGEGYIGEYTDRASLANDYLKRSETIESNYLLHKFHVTSKDFLERLLFDSLEKKITLAREMLHSYSEEA